MYSSTGSGKKVSRDWSYLMEEDEEEHPYKTHPLRGYAESWKRLYWCHSHLTTVTEVASLMAFFSTTAVIELQIKEGGASRDLIVAFVCTTCVLVGVSILVKMISTMVLPQLEAVAGAAAYSDVGDSPHDQMIRLIQVTCLLGHTLAPILFCTDLILIAWIKFGHVSVGALQVATGILLVVQVLFLLMGWTMFKRMRDFNSRTLFLPSRRYSEIAKNWDEDDEERGLLSYTEEGSAVFSGESYSSITSYGAVTNEKSAYTAFLQLA